MLLRLSISFIYLLFICLIYPRHFTLRFLISSISLLNSLQDFSQDERKGVMERMRALFRLFANDIFEIGGKSLRLPRFNAVEAGRVDGEEFPVVARAGKKAWVADVETGLGIRDRAILETLYSTGIRRAELARLETTDLDPDRGILLIREGKGKKDRMVPIGDRALAWIDKYLREVRPLLMVPPDEGDLFLTRFGRAFVPNGVSELVSTAVKKSGVPKRGSAHLFRHTAATLMLEGGADIRYIQQMLGHESLATTQIYTRVAIRKLKEIHELTHPGAKLERRQNRGRDGSREKEEAAGEEGEE